MRYRRLETNMIATLICVMTTGIRFGKEAEENAMLRADHLRCEYLVDPIGVDTPTPRLSWKLAESNPAVKSVVQNGYRILVATSPKLLSPAKADLWDSGKVHSRSTFGIVYHGKPIRTDQTVFWKVQVQDGAGNRSTWSKPATWTAGPKWVAKWIQYPTVLTEAKDTQPNNGYHGGEASREDDVQWVQIDLGKSVPIQEIQLYPARPFDYADTPGFLFPVRFNIQTSEEPEFKSPSRLADFSEKDFVNPGASAVSIPCNGQGRYLRLTVTKLKRRDAHTFSYALAELVVNSHLKNVALNRSVTADKSTESGAWSKARLVDGDCVSHDLKPLPALPATMVRREFTVKSVPSKAHLFITALGAYEVTLNGKRVGTQLLAPEWTDYRDRVQYQGYDVSKLLKPGANVIGITLGDAWYAGRIAWFPRGMVGRLPSVACQLSVDDETVVQTDGKWSSSNAGPIRSSDILDGEFFNANLAQTGWNRTGFTLTPDWKPVRLAGKGSPKIVCQPNEPIEVHARLKPIAITEPKKGTYVVDLGQNMVGWAKVRLKGRAHLTARIRYAEVLSEDGNIYTENLRTAAQTDFYTFASSKPEEFEPHFTYHGFRYVEISNVTSKPDLEDVTGLVFNSHSPEVSTFHCSDAMLNRLWQNILWTQRANLMSSPTDCPQRNERLGWMGDIQAFGQTAVFNMNMNGFFAKWSQDLRDAQNSSGLYPEYVPWPSPKDSAIGSPAWSDAGVFVPWLAYQNYGDGQLLQDHYTSAKRYVDFLHAHNPNGLWLKERGHDFNDWLNGDTLIQKGWPTKGGAVPPEVLATAFMARSTEIVEQMARELGRAKDAKHYGDLARKCRRSFCEAFVDAQGRIKGDTQAGYALALNFNLLPDELRGNAVKRMVESVARYDNHISTGIQSTHRLMLELTRWGHNDLAYKLLMNRTFPSWGYTIDNGATTIWERWDGYVKGRGFQNPGMNSFNHWAIGSVGEWMMKVIGGITPGNQPGWSHPVIQPIPGGGITSSEAAYDSIRGKISVSWKLSGSKFHLSVTVPPNVTATVVMPFPHLNVKGKLESKHTYEIGSGIHQFECAAK